ncbi:MAG TPA: hypothetical protein VJU61_04510 [Polyangiaceae bacterium]|nr:hypothetical protein [Polyangiaceae bacterium]
MRHFSFLLLAALAACGGAPQNPPAAPTSLDTEGPGQASPDRDGAAAATPPAPPSESPAEASRSLPSECHNVGDLCLPPRDFVRRLCQGAFTGAAFHLLEKSSPYSRGYVRSRKVKAVNTLGGPASDAELTFGEEVLILTRTGEAKPGQMEISGMGGYDVLRWDGTCATLADGELAQRPPIPPRHAPLDWRYIDTSIQEALLLDEGIRGARQDQRKHCHGVSLGTRSAACVKADDRLNDRIVLALRSGLALPPPDALP